MLHDKRMRKKRKVEPQAAKFPFFFHQFIENLSLNGTVFIMYFIVIKNFDQK